MNSTNKSTPILVGAIAILAILAGATSTFTTAQPTGTASQNTAIQVARKEEDDDSATTATNVADTATATTSSSPSASSVGSGYKNGTYTATVSYSVPKGATNQIAVQATISDGKITAVSSKDTFSDRESGDYIDSFESSLKADVVGQPLSGFSASRIGGASLTTYAFEEAVQKIATQAKG